MRFFAISVIIFSGALVAACACIGDGLDSYTDYNWYNNRFHDGMASLGIGIFILVLELCGVFELAKGLLHGWLLKKKNPKGGKPTS